MLAEPSPFQAAMPKVGSVCATQASLSSILSSRSTQTRVLHGESWPSKPVRHGSIP
jgi:hypothetical protein